MGPNPSARHPSARRPSAPRGPGRPSETAPGDRLAALVDRVAEQLPALTDAVYAQILAEIEFYRTGTVPLDDLRRSVASNMAYIVAGVREPRAEPDLSAPRETGRRRAGQGAPLPEVLRAFRFAFTTVWESLAAEARGNPDPAMLDVLLGTAAAIWQRCDEYAVAFTDAYRATTGQMLLAQQQRRSALVEAILAGDPRPGGLWELAQLLDLPADGDLVVVVAETTPTIDEGLPNAQASLAERSILSAWRLTPTHQSGLVTLRPGQHEQTVDVLRRLATTRTGLSPVFRSLRDARRAHTLARAAMTGMPSGRADVAEYSDRPLAGLVALDPEENERVVRDVFGPVLELPAEDRRVLLDTLRGWFDHGASYERTGKALYCHPNTVRYRLRRIQSLVGLSLTDPWDVADLASALQAVGSGPDT